MCKLLQWYKDRLNDNHYQVPRDYIIKRIRYIEYLMEVGKYDDPESNRGTD